MLDSLCGKFSISNQFVSFIYSRIKLTTAYWDLHHYIGDGCYEMCQEILDKVKNIQMQDPQLAAAMNAPEATVMQPFGSVPIISTDLCCEKPIKE